LIQAYIYKHFPTIGHIGHRSIRADDTEEQSRCFRYHVDRLSSLVTVQFELDNIQLSAICFTPYEDYREYKPFEWISLFVGVIKLTNDNLPDHTVRQYEYIHMIPDNSSAIFGGDESTKEVDHRWLHFNEYLVQDMGVARYLGDCVAGYIEWFKSISHPYIIQMAEDKYLNIYKFTLTLFCIIVGHLLRNYKDIADCA